MENNLVIKMKNDLAEISRSNVLIEEFCEENELSNKFIFTLNLTLDELVTNIISYGFEDDEEHEILISITFSNEKQELTMQIEDEGVYFNPLNISKPNHIDKPMEKKPIGGLGIHLVKKFVDNVHYERRGNRNILTLTKKTNN